MDITQQILQVLDTKGVVELAGLGILKRVTKHAELDVQNDKILPPKKELHFYLDRGIKTTNVFDDLSSHILKDLLEKEEYNLAGVGRWTNFAGKIDFVADTKVTGDDFYGFEEIMVPRVGAGSFPLNKKNTQAYSYNKIILLLFLFLLPLAGMLYFAITQKEKLFGKASFDAVELSKIQPKATKAPLVDSITIVPQDSIKKDSVHVSPIKTIQ